MSAYGRRHNLPLIPLDGWRDRAACADQAHEMLWDDSVDGELGEHRAARHERAKAICRGHCPVKAECAESVDLRFDEGVRGGHLLPSLDSTRLPAGKTA